LVLALVRLVLIKLLLLLAWLAHVTALGSTKFAWIEYVGVGSSHSASEIRWHVATLGRVSHTSMHAGELGWIRLHDRGQEAHQVFQIILGHIPGLQVGNNQLIIIL
jgi:hypothetical protein